MYQAYSKEKLNIIAADNYAVLRGYCHILENEGYWEGPQSVLKQSIQSILDMYVQTVLIRMILFCGSCDEDDRCFISALPEENIYDIDPCNELSEQVLYETERFFSSPPILLQLCGLRDVNKGSGLMGLFFDALLNIQIALAFYNDSRKVKIAGFIHDYYSRTEAFLGTGDRYSSIVNERYIFMKLCNGILDKSAENLKNSNESFDDYKKKYLLIKDDIKSNASEMQKSSNTTKTGSVTIKKDNMDTNSEEFAADDGIKFDTDDNTEFDTNAEYDTDDNVANNKEGIKKSELDKLLEELYSLIGLENVKSEIRSLVNLIKVRSLREQHNLPSIDMSFHMVFTGSPGTGKTTIARLVAGILRELGILSKGTLVETDRSGLVAGYVGQTALKVKDVVESALGGVLFIDEAYSLSNQAGGNDFGDEAIETLVKLMEDNRDDLIVIVAGYTEEMKKFLKANTGLTSRFNRFIEFSDYSENELIDILKLMSSKGGYMLEDKAVEVVKSTLKSMNEKEKSEFGNARGIRNLFERVIINHANRIVNSENPDTEELITILVDDVR